MKLLTTLFLILSFTSSLAMGEDVCCDSIEQLINFEQSEQNENKVGNFQTENQPHICQHSQKNQDGDHQSGHFCIGCSHAPFVNFSNPTNQDFSLLNPLLNIEQSLLITHPFLEGPFQPPKA